MSVSFGGFNSKAATFKTDETIEAGVAVKMESNGTVVAAQNGEAFCGIALDGDGEYACVQLCGAITVPYTGSAPVVGYGNLAAAEGGVQSSAAGREYLILSVDTAAATVTFLI